MYLIFQTTGHKAPCPDLVSKPSNRAFVSSGFGGDLSLSEVMPSPPSVRAPRVTGLIRFGKLPFASPRVSFPTETVIQGNQLESF